MLVSIFRKLYIRIIEYLDGFLIRGKTGGNNLKLGHCDLPVSEARICYKLKEISSSSNTDNRLLGDNNRLGGDDSIPASEEGRFNFQKVS